MFKNIQCCSDLSHASSGAGKQGKCSESCFPVFLQEQEHRKWGPKGRENGEKRNSSKENATKVVTEQMKPRGTHTFLPSNWRQTLSGPHMSNRGKRQKMGFDQVATKKSSVEMSRGRSCPFLFVTAPHWQLQPF